MSFASNKHDAKVSAGKGTKPAHTRTVFDFFSGKVKMAHHLIK